MTTRRPIIRFMFDEGVPDPVRKPLSSAGHIVILHREILAPGVPDDLVCVTAMVNDAVLVAVDGDMKQFAKRYGKATSNQRFDKLDVIRLCCGEVLAAKRLEQAISFIEHEWSFKLQKAARRLWIDVAEHSLRTHR